MKYEIGDKVKLKSGKIVTITNIGRTLSNPTVYFYGNPYVAIDEEIVRKIMTKNDIIYFKGSNSMYVNKIVEDLKRDFVN